MVEHLFALEKLAEFLRIFGKERDTLVSNIENLKINDKNFNSDFAYYDGQMEILKKFGELVIKINTELCTNTKQK